MQGAIAREPLPALARAIEGILEHGELPDPKALVLGRDQGRARAAEGIEHDATVVIRANAEHAADRVARQFVAMMHLGYYPANHEREFPEVVRVVSASSYFDTAEPFLPLVESVDEIADADLAD